MSETRNELNTELTAVRSALIGDAIKSWTNQLVDQVEGSVPLPRVQAEEESVVTAADAQAAIAEARTMWDELNALPVPVDEGDAEDWVDALEESASELFVATARLQDGDYEGALSDAQEAKEELEPILIMRALVG